MTETQTTPTPPPNTTGWTINVFPTGPTYKIIAFKGVHVIHAEKLTAAMVETFDADTRRAEGLAVSSKLAAIRANKAAS